MPNHIHGIITINNKMPTGNIDVVTHHGVPLQSTPEENVEPCHGRAFQDSKKQKYQNSIYYNQFSKPISGSLSVIINQYKAAVKSWCNKNGYSEFCWQPRFYDHIINEIEEYFAIRDYIDNNPENWGKDDLFI